MGFFVVVLRRRTTAEHKHLLVYVYYISLKAANITHNLEEMMQNTSNQWSIPHRHYCRYIEAGDLFSSVLHSGQFTLDSFPLSAALQKAILPSVWNPQKQHTSPVCRTAAFWRRTRFNMGDHTRLTSVSGKHPNQMSMRSEKAEITTLVGK